MLDKMSFIRWLLDRKTYSATIRSTVFFRLKNLTLVFNWSIEDNIERHCFWPVSNKTMSTCDHISWFLIFSQFVKLQSFVLLTFTFYGAQKVYHLNQIVYFSWKWSHSIWIRIFCCYDRIFFWQLVNRTSSP